uniref:G/T mismatch-specific thymine DNA glycosylase n=1 Tax=Glossina brevipalpis TaxID=37001 RepID=A0A1A9WQ94_9MUSC
MRSNVWECSSNCENPSLKSSSKIIDKSSKTSPYDDKTSKCNEEDVDLSNKNNVNQAPEENHQRQQYDLLCKNSERSSVSKLYKTRSRGNLDDLNDSSSSSSTSTSSSSLTSDTSTTSTSKTSEDNGNYRNGCKLGTKFSNGLTNKQITDKGTLENYNSDNEIKKDTDDKDYNSEKDLKTSPKSINLYNEQIPQKYQSSELYSGNRNNGNITTSTNVNINENDGNGGKPSKVMSPNFIDHDDKAKNQENQFETMQRFDLYKSDLDSNYNTQSDLTTPAVEQESYSPSANFTQRRTEPIITKSDPSNILTENLFNGSKSETVGSIYKNFDAVKSRYEEENQVNSCYEKPEKHNGSAEELQEYLRCAATSDRDLDSFSICQVEAHANKTVCRQQYDKGILHAANEIYAEVDQHHQNYQHHHQSKSYNTILQNQTKQQQEQHQNELELNFHQQEQRHGIPQQCSPDHLFQLQEHQRAHDQLLHNEIQHQMLLQIQQQQHMQNIHAPANVTSSQQNSHLIGFLHPNHHNIERSPLQAHQQIQDVYQDIMMNDEFNEDPNIRYKLSLSPTNAKPENQDDGYETSAGDVLTPNSHVSSTHSVTPQHHMQHGTIPLLPPAAKCDEQRHVRNIQIQHQQSSIDSHLNNSLGGDLTSGDTSVNMSSSEPSYHFIDDELTANETIRNILTPPPQTHNPSTGCNSQDSQSGYMNLGNNAVRNGDQVDLFGIQQAPESMLSSNDVTPTQKHPQSCPELQCTNKSNNKSQQKHVIFAENSGCTEGSVFCNIVAPIQKRRGRKKKLTFIGGASPLETSTSHDVDNAGCHTGQLGKAKERKKHDRFNGMSEEEVVKRTLPDHLCDNLDIVIIGINPGLFAAYKGHHYAGPGNHFWKCLYLSGLTQEQMSADEDYKLIKCGIGFTNMVQRATKGSADLNRKEIKEGSRILLEKLQRFRPKIAVFNGKLIFEVFSGKKDFNFGRQPEYVEGTDTFMWVMPSSSARCAQLPRAADKVPFYMALKKFRDYLNGLIPHIDESECVFTEERIRQQCEQESLKNFVIHDSSQQQSRCYSATRDICPNNSNQPQSSSAIADSYVFDPETNRNSTEGQAPPVNENGYIISSSSYLSQKIPEKKKRGRPKKIRNQIIIDPVTGTKIQVSDHLTGEKYNNILNLSIVPSMEGDTPKKKRGRPKKIKQSQNFLETNTHPSKLSQKANIMSVQTLPVHTGDLNSAPQKHILRGKSTAMYATSPHQLIYSNSDSPMASPAINCAYTKATPPILVTNKPNCEKLSATGEREITSSPVERSTPNLAVLRMANTADNNNSHLNQSPRETSPNSRRQVETSATVVSSTHINGPEDEEIISLHQPLQHSRELANSRYTSPDQRERVEHGSGEHFHQWISPQLSHTHSPTAEYRQHLQSQIQCPSPLSQNQQSTLHYHEQQVQHIQMQQHHQQQVHSQWSRHNQHFDDVSSTPYILSSPHERNHHITEQHHNSATSQFITTDVSRKSLSGLESLVDQIPTISESEPATLISSTPAVAGAVENRHRLQEQSQLQTSFTETQSNPFESPSINNSSVLNDNVNNGHSNLSSQNVNGNFSVSSLVTSSSASDTNVTNQDNYASIQTPRPPSARNTYHHSNFMAAAVLAAATANSPTNLSTSTSHHAPHPQMYMDPHTRLASVDPIYSTAHHHHPIHHHHHPSSHHHTTAHYSPSQHAVEYESNPYSAQANAHTLHMPSPNYPYGYSTSAAQSNYSTYGHPHAAHHGHPHTHPHSHPHATHHLSMFDRLKPSDIGGYGSF